MLWLVQQAGSASDRALQPTVVLARFHTAFNLLGVVLLWLNALEQRWHELKGTLLEAAGRRALPIARLNGALEGLRSALRLTEQLTKAALRFPIPDSAPDALKAAEPAPIE